MNSHSQGLAEGVVVTGAINERIAWVVSTIILSEASKRFCSNREIT